MTEEKEKIWEEATKKSYAENANGTNWDRISIAMDLYAECEVKKLKQVHVSGRSEQLILIKTKNSDGEKYRNTNRKFD